CVSNVVGNKKALGIFKRAGKKITVEDLDGLKDEITKPLREKIKLIEADLALLQASFNTDGSFMGLLQGTSSSGGCIDGFDGIETPTPCDLLVPYGDIEETMAKEMLYPRLDGMLDGSPGRSAGVEGGRAPSSPPTGSVTERMVDEETSCKAKISSQISHNSHQTSRMKLLKKRPIEIQLRVRLFMNHKNPNEAINVESFDSWYAEKFWEQVDTNTLIGWMTHDWLDVPIIHWLCM
ncbi:hypothetical protein Tco_1397228, partial [Tanacetum coccineum]